jgi:hypothetical protein
MSKILTESLYEFRESQEPVNEAKGLFGDLASQGKQFRKMFLPATYALLQDGRKTEVQGLTKWLKKLAEWGWPADKDLKAKVGEQGFKSFQGAIKFMNNNLPSYAVTPGGATQSRAGKDTGKSDAERAKAIAEVVGMEAQELADLLKK